jgi:multidrug resistance efflux pump
VERARRLDRPSSGAEFSVLPAQNASGNWVKVVQRIPVRLELLRRRARAGAARRHERGSGSAVRHADAARAAVARN